MAAQREWFEKDYYKVLGVADDADAKEITKAYRKLAARATPTRTPATPRPRSGSRRSAPRTTCSATRPSARSTTRSAVSVRCGGFGGVGRCRVPAVNFNVGADGLGDILGQMFGRGRRGGGASAAGGPQRGADVEATLTLDFVDAARASPPRCTSPPTPSAAPARQRAPSRAPRRRCARSAAAVASSTTTRASSRSPRRAGRAAARGVVVEQPCPTCHGSRCRAAPARGAGPHPRRCGRRPEDPSEGPGRPGRNGGPAGDLIVECHVAPHPLFGRDGDNLTVRVPVTFDEAALGGDVDVPTLDGPTVKLRLQAGHPVGQPAPGEGQGRRHRQAHRRPDRHGRRAGAHPPHRRAASGRRGPRRGDYRVAQAAMPGSDGRG